MPGMGGRGGGTPKNVDTTKFYKLLEAGCWRDAIFGPQRIPNVDTGQELHIRLLDDGITIQFRPGTGLTVPHHSK